MRREKFLTIIALVLLLSNLLLVSFIFFRRTHPAHRHMEPKYIIIEKLHLDSEQVKRYEKLIQGHRTEIRRNDRTIMELKNKLYQTLNSGDTTTLKDSLIAQIGTVQRQIEMVHYRHFEDIRALCRPEQMRDYEELTKDIAALFAPPHPPGKGGPPPPPGNP